MKKKIPVFSALLGLYVIFELIQLVQNVLSIFEGAVLPGLPGINLGSVMPAVAQLALVVALAVMAVMVTEKPQMLKIAGYLALAWVAWHGISFLSSLSRLLGNGADAIALIRFACSAIANLVMLAAWAVASVALITGKEPKDRPNVFTRSTIVGVVMVLCYALPAIFDGNSNVAGVMISGLVEALPSIAMFAAAQLLHGAFMAPDKTPILTGDLLKKAILGVVLVAISLAVFYACETPKDDGKDYGICGNCGTRIETKYIYSGGCWRCNGNDWSK